MPAGSQLTTGATTEAKATAARIAVLVETGWWGGLEMHTVDLVEALTRAGHHAFVACVGKGTMRVFEQHGGARIPLVQIEPPVRRNWLGWMRTLGAIRADAVLYQKGTLNTGSVSMDLALRMRFPTFLSVEHLEPPSVPASGSRRYLGGLVPGFGLWRHLWRLRGYCRSFGPQRVVCVSDSVKRALHTDYGYPTRKMTTVRNGINIDRFQPDPARRERARQAWTVPADAFVFGSVRRFVRDKGLDVVIDAFAGLTLPAGAKPYLVLVGDGPEEAALKAQAARLGVADRVVFPGFTSSPWDVYPGFDTFVIPSRIEALGVVVLEAMASGCLVIGTRVGGIPEMIRGPELGSLVPADDPGALATAMLAAWRTDTAERALMLERSRRYVVAEFSAQRQFMKIAALLEGRSPEIALNEGIACT